jgi:UMF1 family MFS transporter
MLRKPASRISILAWALYDLGNTAFALNIISLHFALWVVNDMGGTDSHYGYANIVSMVVVLLTAPILGAMSDQTNRRMPFLIAATGLCVFFTVLLGIGGLHISLLIFIVANYMYHVGLIFYDALLLLISNEENRGKVGSFGVGMGYVGSLAAAATGLLLLDAIGREGMFKITAGFFLLFSIPCFVLVKEPITRPFRVTREIILGSIGQVTNTLRRANQFPGLVRFLVGRFFYADAINCLIIFMGIYVTNELGFTDAQAQILLIIAVTSSIIGAWVWGIMVDKIGPKRSLNLVLYLWMIVLLGVSLIPMLNFPTQSFWLVAVPAGIAMAGIWCADRPYLLRLVPAQYIGEFFGLYSMVGRFATILGPAMWVVIADHMGLGRPAAVLALLVFVVISYGILRGVSDRPSLAN